MSTSTKRRLGATSRARMLRRDETEAEYRLWGDGRRLNGHKFVRQLPVGPYFADFVCREARLVVETDGSQHADLESDGIRTRWLNDPGYSVLRLWNHEVLTERCPVLTILAAIDGKVAGPSPGLRFAPATLSPSGRGGDSAAPRAMKGHFSSSPRRGEGGLWLPTEDRGPRAPSGCLPADV